MPFWSKKPTLEDQVLDLKMSSKTLNRQYQRCMSEAETYKKKMRAEIAKHNQETAKVYADSAVRMMTQGKQFMIMSSRVEAAALNLQSVSSMSTVSKAMASSVAAIKSASSSLDITQMYKVMDQFKTACEDNDVMMSSFIDAVGTQDVASSETADSLYQQAAMEFANQNGETMGNVPLGDPQAAAAIAGAPKANPVAGDNSDILSRLNNL